MPFIDCFVCFFGNGMIVSMLEPHLNSVGATITQVGLVFLVQGGVFMVATFVAGIVSFPINLYMHQGNTFVNIMALRYKSLE